MNHSANSRSLRGFTLIEILITLVIVSVAILSLGSFAILIIDNGQQSRTRLSAVHLAEQVLEFWQRDANDYVPSIATDCNLTPPVAAPSYPASSTCSPTTGVSITYTVEADEIAASGPLPSNLNIFQPFTSAGSPMAKVVKVSWSHKGGATRSVFLTHLTDVP